jgi:hypothetical protein
MRYLIRIGKTKLDEWLNGQGKPPALAQHLFSFKKPPGKKDYAESAYEVEGEIEETETVAAHLLSDVAPKLDSRYIVRIRPPDLVESGVHVDDSVLGTTGIVPVDFRHRDLVGIKEQLEKLIGVLLLRIEEGQDRVRRLGKPQLAQALKRFLSLGVTHRPTHTGNVIERVLVGEVLDGLAVDADLASTELERILIPEEVIRLRAFCLHEGGKGTGSPDGNWKQAERELRETYKDHYGHEHLGTP